MRDIFVAIMLTIIVFGFYFIINLKPNNNFDHYFYLAKSFTHLKVNLTDKAEFYHDTVRKNGKTYAPFGPAPAFLMIPAVLISQPISQQTVSIIIGSINIGILYFLLSKITQRINALLVSIFIAFGTVYLWSSVIGTIWNFAHICAILFLTISLLFHFNKKDVFSSLFFALACLSRYPIIGGLLFFFLQLFHERSRLIKFIFTFILVLLPIQLLYNWLRFQNIFEMGYYEIYLRYINSGYAITPISAFRPFGYMDPRNIPMHLLIFLIYPPVVSFVNIFSLAPSPYGMGILFTSPLLLISLWPNFKSKLHKNLFLGASSIALIDFMHYMQGWVQFGYRFVLDFIVFLAIILALKIKLKRRYLLLIILSVIVCAWGVLYDLNYGLL